MAINVAGVVALAVCYLIILVVGIVVGKKTMAKSTKEAVFVADRSLGYFVSILTIAATCVGGAYIVGTAESVALDGVLVTSVVPVGYLVSGIVSSLFFVGKFRRGQHITMFDPFQLKYGKKLSGLFMVPHLLGDLLWAAATLSGLGSTVSVLLDMDPTLAIIISAVVAIIYTVFGGLYAVAYTDVIQFFFILIGLLITFPFCLVNPAVDMSRVSDTWAGHIPAGHIGLYLDNFLVFVLGGIPWQSFFQRFSACRSTRVAWISTLVGCAITLLMAAPPMLVGLVGTATDWNVTSYTGPVPIPRDMKRYILPMVIHHLTPFPVAVVTIGVISAAVMSSCDSAILSSSSILTKNVYNDIVRPKASDREVVWILRGSVVLLGVISTLISIFSKSTYGLMIVCCDLMYVVLFPQLTLLLWWPAINVYGSLAGYFLAMVLRMLSGEPVLNMPAVLKFPFYDEASQTQLFPHRTFTMLLGTALIVLVSKATSFLFARGVIPCRYDLAKCCTSNKRLLVAKCSDPCLRNDDANLKKDDAYLKQDDAIFVPLIPMTTNS